MAAWHHMLACLLAAHLATLAAAAVTPHLNPQCDPARTGYPKGPRTGSVRVDGQERSFELFVPDSYDPRKRMPLWLLVPGAHDNGKDFMTMTEIVPFAQETGFVVAALQGVGDMMNVARHAKALDSQADDVAYTRALLRKTTENLCIDTDRVRCVGFSRGARFCVRLSSELSNFMAGMAAVGGIRYPVPNNATRTMPIIAIHGTLDPVNPYWGKGNPEYWHDSVPASVEMWIAFNGCQAQKWVRKTERVVLSVHQKCTDGAGVVLVMVQGDGHTWPGSGFKFDPHFGNVTNEISANAVIRDFFFDHPRPTLCKDAEPGTACFEAVQAAMRDGIQRNPEWKDLIQPDATFEEFQSFMHFGYHADCPMPCQRVRPQPTPPPSTTASSSTAAAAEDPPPGTTPEGDPGGPAQQPAPEFEGMWTHEVHPGRYVEEIRNGTIRWDRGLVTDITPRDGASFRTTWKNRQYTARFEDDRLVWSDGDVWIREKGNPGSIKWGKNKKYMAEKVAVGAGGSWLKPGTVLSETASRAYSRYGAAAAAVAGAAAVIGALALSTIRSERNALARGTMRPPTVQMRGLQLGGVQERGRDVPDEESLLARRSAGLS